MAQLTTSKDKLLPTIVHGTGHQDIWLPRVEAHCINLGDMALQDLVQAEFSNGINMNIMLNRDC